VGFPFLLGIFIATLTFAAPPDFDSSSKSFQQTLKALVAAKTVNPPGDERKAVEILKTRLKKEGIAFETLDFGPNRTNLVARLKGTGAKKPLLLLAHTDVVGAANQNWSTPPHEMTEKDGFLYGRGVSDDLGMAVANLETMINIKRSGLTLQRDIIAAFTGDEESGGAGIKAIIEKHPEWIDAEFGLNEGGGLVTDESGKISLVNLVSAEKTYQDYTLQVSGTTGHSSVPHGDNAINILAQGLARFSRSTIDNRLLPVTRGYFKKRAAYETGAKAKAMRDIAASKGALPRKAVAVIAQYPMLYALLHTTCTPTLLTGGTRENALPSFATANINCRILPDETIADVQKRIQTVINDSRVKIVVSGDFATGGASSVDGAVPAAVKKVVQATWPGTPIIDAMVNGATDSRFLRTRGIQMYGISPLAQLEGDTARAHGIDERILISTIKPGLEFYYKLVSELATN
jgi:acetylornithine deacetylase/succinyl-diaminopimelate desuccinylase-like protein